MHNQLLHSAVVKQAVHMLQCFALTQTSSCSHSMTRGMFVLFRLKLRMEDDSLAEHVTGYYNDLTAMCTSTAGQRVTMSLSIDPQDGSRVICKPDEQTSCELATTYRVSDCAGSKQCGCMSCFPLTLRPALHMT